MESGISRPRVPARNNREPLNPLNESLGLPDFAPRLRPSADAERRLLDDARGRARVKLLAIGGAVAMAGLVLPGGLAAALFFLVSPPR